MGVKVSRTIGIRNAFAIASNFITAPVDKIASSSGRTNILIMGKAGGGHAGSDLTDTMILASVSLEKPSIVLISIPRDLWIPEIRAKVNSAYHYGGIPLAKESVGKAAGFPIQYGVVIDFSAFKDIVDALGGIEVNVERDFTDNLYPIAGRENDLCGGDATLACRYETITFNSGLQMMNGEKTLKFVRSRHAEGDEGTDTAREARQQKVIEAIKSKVLSPEVYLNPKRTLAIWRVIMKSLEADIDTPSGAILARKALDGSKSVNKYLIPDGLLVNPPVSKIYDRQYVFIPKAGNGKWKEINNWFVSTLY